MTYLLARMISDGRAEAKKIHELAERAEVHHVLVRFGPPGSASMQDQAAAAYVEALRNAYSTITERLDECESAAG